MEAEEESLLGLACDLLERESRTPRGSGLPTTGPLAILLLAIHDDALDAEVTAGRHLLKVLEPLLDRRGALLEEARRHLLDSNEFWESAAREFGSAHQVAALLAKTPESEECKGKKKPVLAHHEGAMEREGAAACSSPLLQLVYPRKTPLKNPQQKNKFFGDADSWRTHICVRRWEQSLCLQHRKLLHSCQNVRAWNELAMKPLQNTDQAMLSIVEVPSPLQRTLKFYVDWDMKVDAPATTSAPADIERIRQLALGTPRAIARILRDEAGRIAEDDELFVLVKEGTRDLDGGSTKVSFHFVFQLLVTHAQFRQLYEDVVDFLVKSEDEEECLDVACALELAECVIGDSSSGGAEAARARILASSSRSPVHALVGLDLHPRQNAAQGLASLGARKALKNPGTRVVGMMSCATGEWVQGYVENAHPLAVLADASIAVPGPRCIGVVMKKDTNLRGEKRGQHDRSLRATLARIQAWEKQNVSLQGNLLSSSTAKLISRVSETLGTLQQRKRHDESFVRGDAAVAEVGGSSSNNRSLDEVVSAMPQWFKQCLALSSSSSRHGEGQDCCDAAARSQFATANANMRCLAKIGRPHSVPRDRCIIVHVHGSEVCMCTRSLMEVPFKSYERHGSNGVLYCFYRDQVFVSCLKEECCRALRATRDSMRAMSRVLEECIFSECGRSWRTHDAVVYGGLCKEQRDQIERIEEMKLSYMACASSGASMSSFHDLSNASSSSCFAHAIPGGAPVNIRRFAKVPSRNIVCSGKKPSARRTWVQVTEPMLRSYMSWAFHRNVVPHTPTSSMSSSYSTPPQNKTATPHQPNKSSSSSSSSVFHSFRGTTATMKRSITQTQQDEHDDDMKAKVDKALKKMRASAKFVYNPYG